MSALGKSAKVSLDRRVLQELSSLRFVDSQRNVVILGPVGVGKTFVASALVHLAWSLGIQCPQRWGHLQRRL